MRHPFTAGLVGAALVVSLSSPAAGRVGFVNTLGPRDGGRDAIAKLRGAVIARTGLRLADHSRLRAALETPTTPPAEIVKAIALLQQADQALSRFSHQQAVRLIDRAERLLCRLPPTHEHLRALAGLQLLAGQVFVSAGRASRAVEAFRLVRRLEPQQQLDPARYRPTVIKLYGQAGQQARRHVAIRVVTTPPGAVVLVDGVRIGVTPLERGGLEPGEHYLSTTLPGYVATTTKVRLPTGTLRHTLRRLSTGERLIAAKRRLSDGSVLRVPDLDLIARTAGLQLVVIVRETRGQIEMAAFDANLGSLGAWWPLAQRDRWLETLPDREKNSETAAASFVAQPPAPASPQRTWYQTWWGKSAIIGTAVAVVVGVVTAVVLSRGGDSSYAIDRFCWEGRCP